MMGRRVNLPPDSHVHSQWSWDATAGSMEATCQRATEIGLPAVVFTEHADFTGWSLQPGARIRDHWRPLVRDGVLTPPQFDLTGYLACLHHCRARFPDLRILSGVELGEPHWHASRSAALLGDGGFDRVLASVHSTSAGTGRAEIADYLRDHDPAPVMRGFLTETAALVSQFEGFDVLAHIDYPVRYWPPDVKPHDPIDYRDEYRQALRTLATAGKALEVNTRVPLHPQVLAWWREEGGQAITFASDAHARKRWRPDSRRPHASPTLRDSAPAVIPPDSGAGRGSWHWADPTASPLALRARRGPMAQMVSTPMRMGR